MHIIFNFFKLLKIKINSLSFRFNRSKFFYFTFAFIALVLLVFILFRNTIISSVVESKIENFNKYNQAELSVENIKFKGISTVYAEKINLKPKIGENLIYIEKIELKISFWNLFLFKIKPLSIEVENFILSPMKSGKENNYSFLFQTNKNDNSVTKPENKYEYGYRIYKLINTIFFKIPNKINIENFQIRANSEKQKINISIPNINISNSSFSIPIEVFENNLSQKWLCVGDINPEKENVRIKLFSNENKKINLPFINYKWAVKLQFDTLDFNFSENSFSNSINHIKGKSSISGLILYNDKISTKDVLLKGASFDFSLNIGDNYFELDSSTIVNFNKLTFNPYIKYCLYPSRQVWLKINKPQFPSQDLFESLPEGLFLNLEGIKTAGNLSYKLDFYVDIDSPDSISFLSELNRHNFKIISFGNTDFSKINDEFEYTAYEKGEAVRQFLVGASNPNFRRLDQISTYLKNAVLISEDAGFFWHRGFLPEAIKESITKNIKTRRFARGGSTISMQLVKNVFLNRNKTLSRKIEEALIVWLIENNNISTKERMFEVYLNIIEWGPLIYGANEAAHFYFNKDASKLTLPESLFLSNLIPRPKWFKYSFDKNGNLKQFIVDYMNFAINRMLKKEMITQEEYDNFVPVIELKGIAKKLIEHTDSIPDFQLEM